MKIIVRSLGFSAIPQSQEDRRLCVAHASQYLLYKLEKVPGSHIKVRKPVSFYGSSNFNRDYYNFHINTLEQFLNLLKGHQQNVPSYKYEVFYENYYNATKANLTFNKSFVLRDYQEHLAEFALDKLDNSEYKNILLGIATGQGKTLSSMYIASVINQKTCIIIKPGYIDKWIDDVKKLVGVDKKRLYVIKGGSSMRKLCKLASKGRLKADIIIISNRTYQNFISLFEDSPVEFSKTYACTPYNIMEKMGIGLLLRDEIHQDFHLNYKIDTYSHVPHAMALSATLINSDPFMCKMYEVMFPIGNRYNGGKFQKFTDAKAYYYYLESLKGIRTSYTKDGFYSHTAYEESIMKWPNRFRNYLQLIEQCLREHYVINKRQKKRALIYCATVDMCGYVTKYLKQKLPQYDIRRYVEDDAYENIMTADISISTLGSASTALDIPDLTTVIMTTAVASLQSNIQAIGRLRKLEDDAQLDFVYFVCKDLNTHLKYEQGKIELFNDRVKSHTSAYSGIRV